MERIICLLIGYVFGLFQTAYFYGKSKGIDIRQYGSGNSGTTNALRVLGTKAGLIVLLGDCLKCIAAVTVVRMIYGDHQEIIYLLCLYGGAGAVLGHNFPFYLKFKGGKGIAVLAGLVLATGLVMVPIPLTAFLIAVLLTRYVSLGSLLASSMFFLEVLFYGQLGGFDMAFQYRMELYVLVFLLMALAWVRHKENIKRLLAGTENPFRSKK